ncbi:hypothetical protein KRX19_05745 [Cardiobacteriaceae bacterium TAE3-ERU3]|nr:hypothetical protein [Cardiobacteriaceae bacterium TAE3-ERU3]
MKQFQGWAPLFSSTWWDDIRAHTDQEVADKEAELKQLKELQEFTRRRSGIALRKALERMGNAA